MENYHSTSLTKREKSIIILGMLHIANADYEIDSEEFFAIDFNSKLLGITLNEYHETADSMKVVDDQILFNELKNMSLLNKKFVVRAFLSVVNTSESSFDIKFPVMCNLLEDMNIDPNEIENLVK